MDVAASRPVEGGGRGDGIWAKRWFGATPLRRPPCPGGIPTVRGAWRVVRPWSRSLARGCCGRPGLGRNDEHLGTEGGNGGADLSECCRRRPQPRRPAAPAIFPPAHGAVALPDHHRSGAHAGPDLLRLRVRLHRTPARPLRAGPGVVGADQHGRAVDDQPQDRLLLPRGGGHRAGLRRRLPRHPPEPAAECLPRAPRALLRRRGRLRPHARHRGPPPRDRSGSPSPSPASS